MADWDLEFWVYDDDNLSGDEPWNPPEEEEEDRTQEEIMSDSRYQELLDMGFIDSWTAVNSWDELESLYNSYLEETLGDDTSSVEITGAEEPEPAVEPLPEPTTRYTLRETRDAWRNYFGLPSLDDRKPLEPNPTGEEFVFGGVEDDGTATGDTGTVPGGGGPVGGSGGGGTVATPSSLQDAIREIDEFLQAWEWIPPELSEGLQFFRDEYQRLLETGAPEFSDYDLSANPLELFDSLISMGFTPEAWEDTYGQYEVEPWEGFGDFTPTTTLNLPPEVDLTGLYAEANLLADALAAGATPEEKDAIRDEVARDMGFNDWAELDAQMDTMRNATRESMPGLTPEERAEYDRLNRQNIRSQEQRETAQLEAVMASTGSYTQYLAAADEANQRISDTQAKYDMEVLNQNLALQLQALERNDAQYQQLMQQGQMGIGEYLDRRSSDFKAAGEMYLQEAGVRLEEYNVKAATELERYGIESGLEMEEWQSLLAASIQEWSQTQDINAQQHTDAAARALTEYLGIQDIALGVWQTQAAGEMSAYNTEVQMVMDAWANDLAAWDMSLDAAYRGIDMEIGITEHQQANMLWQYTTQIMPMMDRLNLLLAQEELSAQDREAATGLLEGIMNFLGTVAGVALAVVL